jgi:predicted MFS family arabinose efflux permease
VADAFPPERRPWAVGIISIGQPMAWVVGLPLIGFVADGFGWRWSFIAVPVLFSLIGLFFLRYVPSSADANNRRADEQLPISSLSTILRAKSPRSWILAELTAYSGWAGTLVFLGAYYISVHDRSTSLTGILLSLTALAFVGGSLLSNRVVTRIGIKPAISLGATVSAVALIITMTISPGVWLSLALLMIFGMMQGVRGAAASVLGLMQSPEHQGAMMGFRASVVQLGYVLGGVAGGVLLAAGGYELLAIMFGLLIVIASIYMAISVDTDYGRVVAKKPG